MLLKQSFRYFKGILIFLQIYSIFYLLLLSVYVISTARRTIFWHNSKQLKCYGQSWELQVKLVLSLLEQVPEHLINLDSTEAVGKAVY